MGMECAICLEGLYIKECDFEKYEVITDHSAIVRLPCKCASSFFHLACIHKMLESGEDKNFCPCCRTKYFFLVPRSQRNELDIVNNETYEVNRVQQRSFKCNFILHILLNTFVNIFFGSYVASGEGNKKNIWFFISLVIKIFFNLFLAANAYENERFPHNFAILFNHVLQIGVVCIYLLLHGWTINIFMLSTINICMCIDLTLFAFALKRQSN